MRTLYITLLLLVSYTCSCRAQNELYKRENYITNSDTLQYRILYPKNFSLDKQYPLVLFLHGSGERGNDNEKQLIHGSKLFVSEIARDSFPSIVVFPQCPAEDYWASVEVDRSTRPFGLDFQYEKEVTKPLAMVMSLVEELVSTSFVKKEQVYVMGLSMGGMGAFEILYRKPNLFAAAVPICGGGAPNFVSTYAKKVPLWIFHGAKDNVVAPQSSLNMASAILEAGGYPRLTLYENAEHDSWTPAFEEPDLLPWLFSKRKAD